MEQWITLEHAAELMGRHPRSLLRNCREGKLRLRSRLARTNGSGRRSTEVALSSLPPMAQQRWLKAHHLLRPIAGEFLVGESASTPATSSGMSQGDEAWALYRYRVIEPLITGSWAQSVGSELHGTLIEQKSDYVRGLTAIEWTKPNGKKERFSPSGIWRLLRRFRDHGLAGLANKERVDRGQSQMPEPLQLFILAAYCSGGSSKSPALRSIREVARLVDEERAKRALLHRENRLIEYIRERFAYAEDTPADYYLLPLVSYGTIRRYCQSIPEPIKVYSRLGLRAYRDRCEHTSTRDYASIRPMEYVVFDHRRCDVFVILKRRGEWVLIRPWETIAMDMKSRLVLSVVQCEVPSALSVASCIRQLIARCGRFENAYLDNGKEFRAQYIDGRGSRQAGLWRQDLGAAEFATTRGVLARLGVNIIHTLPYSGRSKPIESSFRNPAYFERTLAGACGNRPANRPEWLAGWEREFKQWVAGRAEAKNHPFHGWDGFRELKQHFYFEQYNRRPHSGREMRGRSPEQVMREEFVELGLVRPVDLRELDLLMQKRKLRTVQNGGTFVVSWGGEDCVYSHPDLFWRQGEQLETSYDPYEISSMNVFEPGGKYLCTARCEPLRGMGEREFSEDIKERRRMLKQTRGAVEQLQRMATLPSPEERMQWSRALRAATPESEPKRLPDARPMTDEPILFLGS